MYLKFSSVLEAKSFTKRSFLLYQIGSLCRLYQISNHFLFLFILRKCSPMRGVKMGLELYGSLLNLSMTDRGEGGMGLLWFFSSLLLLHCRGQPRDTQSWAPPSLVISSSGPSCSNHWEAGLRGPGSFLPGTYCAF